MGQFVAKALGSTEVVWGRIFQQSGSQYRPPTLVLYDGQVRSACGMGQAAMGPFYCPGDEKLYIDLAFFRDLQTRFRAPGDFAQAYVIAHEVGHHVQKLTGTFQKMEAARGRASQAEGNRASVRMELQADCYAGVWGHHAGTMNQLDSGDIAEALNAATAIGDDRLQKQTQGRVVPESFTHGSSEQRVRWFRRGLESDVRRTATRSRPARLDVAHAVTTASVIAPCGPWRGHAAGCRWGAAHADDATANAGSAGRWAPGTPNEGGARQNQFRGRSP
jgi:predicted metalloprotease